MNTVRHTPQSTLVYGTHSGWCWSEKSKVARELKHKVFCLVWLVLNEVLEKRAENDSPYCFSWLGMPIWYLFSISVLLYMYIHNCVHIMFKIWYITIILPYLLLCAVHLMQGFVSEKRLLGNYNYSQDRSFLTGNGENPALVLSNVHNRTSARDGPVFGSMGPSMNTSSLPRRAM